MRTLLNSILSAAVALALVAPAMAQVAPSARVAALRKQAGQLSAKGKHREAVQRIEEARAQVRSDRRQAMGALPRPSTDPRYKAEVKALNSRLKLKYQKGSRTAAARQAILKEAQSARKALEQKYRSSSARALINRRAEEALRIGARYSLLDADLEEEQSRYLDRGGNKTTAGRLRQHALVQRFEAYRTLKKDPEAGAIAGRLLALNPRDPDLYRRVAEFHQEQCRYPEAAAAWRRGLEQLESQRGSARDRARNQAYYYRQLAFVYTRSGKNTEARQALDRALQLEHGGG